MNYYFEVKSRKEIKNIEELVSLNIPKNYENNNPGKLYQSNISDSINEFPHKTSGLFRVQVKDWSLIPKCFRNLTFTNKIDDIEEVHIQYDYLRKTSKFIEFCERAENQNPGFPQNITDRMSIAQHFGVPTPLLDWSKNILTAAFFAINGNIPVGSNAKVYLYHIPDERFLNNTIPNEEELPLFKKTTYIKPFPIDRRIERQKAIFTYHPHPELKPTKIPINTYIIDWEIIDKLTDLMNGFGFTEDYYFPDYAGIAKAVKKVSRL